MGEILLVQGIGAIGYATLAYSYFKEEKKQILFMQIFSYIFFTIHFYMLSGITGAICNFIGLFALVAIYLCDKYKWKSKKYIATFFILLLVIVNIATFQNFFSIFPLIASVIVIVSFLEENEEAIRGIGIVSVVSWLIYAIAYKSYISIPFEVVTLIEVCVAYLKNTKKEKK